MEDEIKIANCGCGGEAVHGKWVRKVGVIAHAVGCKNCGIQTKPYPTEAEAITAWNRAMGAKDINVPNKFVTDTNVGNKERTAKVVSDDVIITVNGYRYHYEEYLCNACKKKVFSCDSYCSHCGAKLDWSKE